MDDEALDKMIGEIMESRSVGWSVDAIRWAINNRVGAMLTPKAARLQERLEAMEAAGKARRFGRGEWRPPGVGGSRV